MSAAPAFQPDDAWGIFSLNELAEGGVDAYLQKVAETTAAEFDATGASIFLRDGTDDVYRLRARAGRHSTVPDKAVIVKGNGLAGRVVSGGVARIIGDISNERDLIDFAPTDRTAVLSSLVVPLVDTRENVIGVLNLSRGKDQRKFQYEDLDRAKGLAAMIYLAVANAKLVETLRHETAETERLRRLAEIGQMTAAVAHEIRNPLTGIRSAAQMVRENPEMADEFLAMIEEEALKLNDLCEEFLAFAKPMEINFQESNLAETVGTACELSRPDFDRDGVVLTVETGSNVPRMNLDRRRVEQVVHNLLRNARQACTSGGHVSVRVDGTRLTVRDDGQGISAAQMDRLFSPFFTTKPDGTGLGLSNVRRIVEAHGGRVSAISEPGKGSVFTVEFERSEV
jgi:signal transduction histidine kinase